MATSGTITGTLHDADYGDNEDRDLEAGSYDYTLSVGGDGKLAFKVETRELTGGGARWVTVEEKSKIRGGTVLTGSFSADETVGGQTEVRFNFNREFLSRGVEYTLKFSKD
jgi:hypothetical protein